MITQGKDQKEFSEEDSQGYFPFEYLMDFFNFLCTNKNTIEFITYDDLPWGDDYDFENNYPSEYKNWREELRRGVRDNSKIYVLIQHDVDSSPERSLALIREEERLQIPANIMIFNRRVNRKYLKSAGRLLYTDYELDHEYLANLQEEKKFVVAYHSNAYDQSLYDKKEALRIFEEDVIALRKLYRINYFSPHGGPSCPDGLSNNCLPIPEALRTSLRWVHNRKKVRFDGEYSDGGLNNPRRNPGGRDLRDFVRKWERGKRYRILIHPQYYHTPWKVSRRLRGTPWYDNLLERYSLGKGLSAWDDVRFADEQRGLKSRLSLSAFSLKNMIRKHYVRK